MINALNMESVAVCRVFNCVWRADIKLLIGVPANIARFVEIFAKAPVMVGSNISVAFKMDCPSASEIGTGVTFYFKYENVAREQRFNFTLTSEIVTLVGAVIKTNAEKVCYKRSRNLLVMIRG